VRVDRAPLLPHLASVHVKAQTTRTSNATIIEHQIGYAARKPTFTIALSIARTTPIARAHTRPANRASPATSIQPTHAVSGPRLLPRG
jgi:hypothetical protein